MVRHHVRFQDRRPRHDRPPSKPAIPSQIGRLGLPVTLGDAQRTSPVPFNQTHIRRLAIVHNDRSVVAHARQIGIETVREPRGEAARPLDLWRRVHRQQSRRGDARRRGQRGRGRTERLLAPRVRNQIRLGRKFRSHRRARRIRRQISFFVGESRLFDHVGPDKEAEDGEQTGHDRGVRAEEDGASRTRGKAEETVDVVRLGLDGAPGVRGRLSVVGVEELLEERGRPAQVVS